MYLLSVEMDYVFTFCGDGLCIYFLWRWIMYLLSVEMDYVFTFCGDEIIFLFFSRDGLCIYLLVEISCKLTLCSLI